MAITCERAINIVDTALLSRACKQSLLSRNCGIGFYLPRSETITPLNS